MRKRSSARRGRTRGRRRRRGQSARDMGGRGRGKGGGGGDGGAKGCMRTAMGMRMGMTDWNSPAPQTPCFTPAYVAVKGREQKPAVCGKATAAPYSAQALEEGCRGDKRILCIAVNSGRNTPGDERHSTRMSSPQKLPPKRGGMCPRTWTHVGTSLHPGHMDGVAAIMPSQATCGGGVRGAYIGHRD